MVSHTKHLLVALNALTALACSSNDQSADGTSSGGSSAAGTNATGGASISAGTNATGGASISAGTNATGGTSISAGTNATGGRTVGGAANGGSGVGTGGSNAGGGGTVSETGGAIGSGGSTASTSKGCNSGNKTSPCGSQGTTCSMTVAGSDRTYYIQLPSPYDPGKAYPVIFQFHPWGGSADMALTMYQLNSKFPDAIYVTPQGLDSNGSLGWANTDGRDIEFTKAMLAEVQSKYCVDNTRIFSTGFSYGGMMSFAIGCEMSDVFRAIAPMSGALYSDFNCQGTGPHIAMWGSHGISDDTVPIEDGRSALAKILKENHCGTETEPVEPSPCVKYKGCDPGYDVTWCEWNGGHGIPNFASSAIANFFKQFK
jgi:poly(3-hydroxybutyrate) depolymerase